MKNQVGGFLGAIVPFLTKTILPTVGLSAAIGAISSATNKTMRESGVGITGTGSGLYRAGDTTGSEFAFGGGLYRSGDGLYRSGDTTTADGLLPVSMDKKL